MVRFCCITRAGIYANAIFSTQRQPWSDGSFTSLPEQPRAPILALSTFSNLLDIVNILVRSEQPTISFNYNHDLYDRLQNWRASLPSRLNYVHSGIISTPLTPPAVLLQIAFYCTALAARPFEPWIDRLLEFMELCQERLPFTCLPPTIKCLFAFISKYITRLSVDEGTRVRIQNLQTGFKNMWPARLGVRDETHDLSTVPNASLQIPAPDILQMSLAATHSNAPPTTADDSFATPIAPTQFNVPHRQATNITSNQSLGSFLIPTNPVHADPRFPDSTPDLESFFDDLASLDSAPRLDNQPQFMQNLGFAPDANMADLFSEYIPLQSSAFLSRDDAGAAEFDQYQFYDAS